MKIMYRILGK